MKNTIAAVALAVGAALILAGCARAHSKVAVVDVLTLEQVWPKYINYYNQLNANLAAIRESKQSNAAKARAYAQFQQQEARWQAEVTNDVRTTATDIAKQRGYELVVTKQGVAYGGDDITPDVETALKIPVPTPSPGK
jgi:outer membrane protein